MTAINTCSAALFGAMILASGVALANGSADMALDANASGTPETEMIGPCLMATTTGQGRHGAKLVRWTTIDAPECRPTDTALQGYANAAAADLASTALGLSRAGLVEGNPLGLGAGIAIKAAGFVALALTDPSPQRTRWAARASALQWGATASNLCLWAGAIAPACYAIGLGIGATQWPE